jgi:hypothetical protein
MTTQVELHAHLMSDEAKAFVAIGESFAAHETVNHSSREYVRDSVHVNSVEGFNARVRRTIAGVFHHISPELADLYFHEIGFRWSQRIVTGQAVRKSRSGKESMKPSGHGCRLRCSYSRCSVLPLAAKCAEATTAASISNPPWLSLVDKGRVR